MSRLPPILPVPSRPHRLDVRFLLFGPLPRRASLFVRRGSFDVGNNNFVIRPFSMEVHFQPLVAGGTLIVSVGVSNSVRTSAARILAAVGFWERAARQGASAPLACKRSTCARHPRGNPLS